MKSKSIIYYDWSDIRIEICKKMNIPLDKFRDYHDIIGGSYKDLWHEWLHYFDSEVANDTLKPNDLGESIESKKEWIANDKKEWLFPFVDAVYAVWDEFEIEYVKYSW